MVDSAGRCAAAVLTRDRGDRIAPLIYGMGPGGGAGQPQPSEPRCPADHSSIFIVTVITAS